MLIPAGEQSVLAPSSFVVNGTMPLAFTVYGIVAYSAIAVLFLLIQNKMSGKRIMQGLKYGLSCCAIWIIYLLEPLPHVAFLDKFTYPIADSIALVIMGISCGLFLGKNRPQCERKYPGLKDIVPIIAITICFVIGRLLQYLAFNSYSSFTENKPGTLIWCIFTGFIISIVLMWINHYVVSNNRILHAMTVGALLFGVDLIFFNFFMPLVFHANMLDLIMRTGVDVISVTVGCLSLRQTDLSS